MAAVKQYPRQLLHVPRPPTRHTSILENGVGRLLVSSSNSTSTACGTCSSAPDTLLGASVGGAYKSKSTATVSTYHYGISRRRQYMYRPWRTYPDRVQLLTTLAAAAGGGGGGGGNNSSIRTRSTDDTSKRRDKLKVDNNYDNNDNCDKEPDEEDGGQADDGPSDSLYKILTGRPQPNPEDYAGEPKRTYEIPKTIEGWKTVLRKTWHQYYDTFEGWETADEREEREREERRAKGIADEDVIDAEEEDVVYELEIDEDAIKRKQREITDNFGRNVNVLSSTGRDLVQQAKDTTGIRTKEDLQRWAGDQMKLMTACLSEFMGGYREGRDEEVDRMLNEYFKELDEAEETGKDEKGKSEDIHGEFSRGDVETDNDEIENKNPKAGRRRGRKQRQHKDCDA
mmetsp:Transcript_23393/g.50735  ORF Transcript_23393/g.50735 Transcript_23393/m.50735 type:complete len:398 (-) Transcript_23393:68-1261(-)